MHAPSVTQAVARIRTVDVGDEKGLGEAVQSWLNHEALDEIMRFMATATEKVNDWSATHVSAISREEARSRIRRQPRHARRRIGWWGQ